MRYDFNPSVSHYLNMGVGVIVKKFILSKPDLLKLLSSILDFGSIFFPPQKLQLVKVERDHLVVISSYKDMVFVSKKMVDLTDMHIGVSQ